MERLEASLMVWHRSLLALVPLSTSCLGSLILPPAAAEIVVARRAVVKEVADRAVAPLGVVKVESPPAAADRAVTLLVEVVKEVVLLAAAVKVVTHLEAAVKVVAVVAAPVFWVVSSML
ncbi:hypothetical protein GGI09_008588 [Coemansia sp. S100]|nr:hypothetical protein GGI09_008588 [Coemansia sp. S100]